MTWTYRGILLCAIPAGAEGPQAFGVVSAPALDRSQTISSLAVLLVGHPDHLRVDDVGVAVQKLLDLAGIDVLAAADHHVLDPAGASRR